jgi:hypothetical protein
MWILQERQWSGEELQGGIARPDLSGADLFHANLKRASLGSANLSGARLIETDLGGADLSDTNLKDAHFTGADLRDADLGGADLSGAALDGTNLSGVSLRRVDLRGADMRHARMDPATVLRDITLSAATRLGDVAWNGVPLTQVDWSQARRLGDEQYIKAAKKGRDRIIAYHAAARAYRGLSVVLHDQGLTADASDYRLREQRLERRAQRREGKLGAWFVSALLDMVAGHGERPGRIFVSYLIVVVAFAAAYLAVGLPSGLIPGPLDAVVFSPTSFHGRGFFPNEAVSLHDPLTVLAASEAVVGLFIELTLIATFSRRFLGN